MSRERNIYISAINIAMHSPHSPQRYVDLFSDSFKERHIVAQGDLHRLMIGTLHNANKAVELNEITGEIYRFVKLDPNEPWFDVSTGKPASENDLEKIQIPANLLPHLQVFPFIFYPDSHELWYVCQDRGSSLGPNKLQKFLQNLFDHTGAKKGYPPIAATALPEHEMVDELLKWPNINRITMQFKRPNADDGHGAEQRLMAMMEEQNLGSLTQELVAGDKTGIIPNQATRDEAIAASRNGVVTVRGTRPDGTQGEESTTDKPLRWRRSINESLETVMSILRRTKSTARV